MSKSFVCIVASHYRTPLWILSAKKISQVIVICRNRDDLDFALDLCDADDIVIDLTDDKITASEYNVNLVHKFEEMHNVSLMSFVLSDRRLRTFSKKKIELYLSYLISQFDKIDFSKIMFSMSEPTWFHERLFLLYCEKNSVHSIHLRPDRYAIGFFNIFLGDEYTALVKNKSKVVSNDDIHKYRKLISGLKNPRDFDTVKNRNFFSMDKFKSLSFLIKLYFRNGGSTYIHQPFYLMIINKLKNIFRGYYLKYFHSFDTLSEEPSDSALLLLHMQPEQSIDVANWQYSDQINTARRLRERLPTTTTLYVKDHPHCAGMRSLDFYSHILKLPNTRLLNPFLDTKSLLPSVASVYSASGTGVFEAGVQNIPCGCFNNIFFEGVCQTRIYLEYNNKLPSLIKSESVSNVKLEQTLKNIIEGQFEGDVRDMLRDSLIMSEDNIKNVSKALKQLADHEIWDF
jgi:hypothetical protein